MAAPSKLVPVYGLVGKLEGAYNGGVSLSPSTDGILLEELPQLAMAYANDGARPAPAGSLGYQRKVGPAARTASFPLKVAFKGPFTAYSASVFSSLHNLLRMAGFDAAGSFGVGTEKWTYTPTPFGSSYASGGFGLYSRGELYNVQAALADMTLTIDGPGVPVWEFGIQSLMPILPADVSVPAITYPFAAIDAPKAVGILFTLGNFTAGVIRKLTLKLGRQINPRLDVNANGAHQGYAPGRRTPTIEVEYEAPALVGSPFTGVSTIDPYSLFDTATPVACGFQIGVGQYTRIKMSAAQAQVMKVPELSADNAVAITKLTLQCNPSSPSANDDLSIVTD